MEFLISILPLIALFLAMWFIIIRPAQKRQRAAIEMQNALKVGDRIVTIGGLHGEITQLDETHVFLKVNDKDIVKYERQAVGRVITE